MGGPNNEYLELAIRDAKIEALKEVRNRMAGFTWKPYSPPASIVDAYIEELQKKFQEDFPND